jgi:hypothetical protein
MPKIIPVIASRHGPNRKHLYSIAVPVLHSCLLGFPRDRYPASPLARWWLRSSGCLSRLFRRRCIETNVVSEPFASNDCFSAPTVLALRKYATLCWLPRPQICLGIISLLLKYNMTIFQNCQL